MVGVLHLGNQQSYALGAPGLRIDGNHTPGNHRKWNILTFPPKKAQDGILHPVGTPKLLISKGKHIKRLIYSD